MTRVALLSAIVARLERLDLWGLQLVDVALTRIERGTDRVRIGLRELAANAPGDV